MVKPISSMGSDLSKRINKIESSIERNRRDIVRAAATEARDVQRDELAKDAGGDLRLSRVRSGRGAAIGARYDLTGGSAVTATIKATGPVPLLANPSKAHPIPRRPNVRLLIPGIGVRARVNHPGTKGKDSWNRGRERATPRVRTRIERATDQAVKRAFLSGG